MNKRVSVILPVYNQESHIEVIYKRYVPLLTENDIDFELLFVVNGSRDKSYEACQKIARIDERVKAYEIKAAGWGRAVKYGIGRAEGDIIVYTNSARTNARELLQVIKYAGVDGQTVVKANRIIRESFIRRAGSVLYNFENRYFFKTAVWDVNGTPKAFPSGIIKSLDIQCDNDLIDAEIMARCHANNIPVIEVPVYATDRISGKSTTNFKSALKMYFGLIKLKKTLSR